MTVLNDAHVVEVAEVAERPDVPRRPERINERDLRDAAGSAVAALAAVWCCNTVLAWDSWMGSALLWLVAFLVVFGLVTRATLGRLAATDRVVTVFLWMISAIAVMALGWMITYVAVRGWKRLGWSFLTDDLKTVGPNDEGGGVAHAILGTLIQVGLCTIVCVPLAILSAVYLHELKGRLAPVLRFIVDAMSGLPSIIAGLLVYTVWILRGGHSYSGAAGAAALAVLMLPTVTRTSEELLKTVHDGLRESALALGAPQWQVVLRVVLPTARAGLITAVILGIARVAGETAPLLFTSFGSRVTNVNPTREMSSLPVLVWGLIRQQNEVSRERAWSAAFLLILLVLILFVLARLAGDWSQIRQRQRARRRRSPATDDITQPPPAPSVAAETGPLG